MKDVFAKDSKIKVSEDVMSVEKNEVIRLILFNSDSKFYTIEGLAKSVWAGINEGKSIHSIMVEMAKAKKVKEEELKPLIENFVKDLVDNKILTIID